MPFRERRIGTARQSVRAWWDDGWRLPVVAWGACNRVFRVRDARSPVFMRFPGSASVQQCAGGRTLPRAGEDTLPALVSVRVNVSMFAATARGSRWHRGQSSLLSGSPTASARRSRWNGRHPGTLHCAPASRTARASTDTRRVLRNSNGHCRILGRAFLGALERSERVCAQGLN